MVHQPSEPVDIWPGFVESPTPGNNWGSREGIVFLRCNVDYDVTMIGEHFVAETVTYPDSHPYIKDGTLVMYDSGGRYSGQAVLVLPITRLIWVKPTPAKEV